MSVSFPRFTVKASFKRLFINTWCTKCCSECNTTVQSLRCVQHRFPPFPVIPLRFTLTWVTTHKDSCWNGTPIVGMAVLWLARPFLDVAADQLPSPWSLGAPTGKDICQRESWQLYFLFHLGLFLIHPSCSFPPFFSIFFLFCSQLKPTFYFRLSVPDFTFSILSSPLLYSFSHCLFWLTSPLVLIFTVPSLQGTPHTPCLHLPSCSLFSSRNRWNSHSLHDCTSQLSKDLEACWRALI